MIRFGLLAVVILLRYNRFFRYIKDKMIQEFYIVRKAINLTQIMQGFPSRRILKSDFRF